MHRVSVWNSVPVYCCSIIYALSFFNSSVVFVFNSVVVETELLEAVLLHSPEVRLYYQLRLLVEEEHLTALQTNGRELWQQLFFEMHRVSVWNSVPVSCCSILYALSFFDSSFRQNLSPPRGLRLLFDTGFN